MNIGCIGAINWDRKLRLSQPLQTGTSNPVQRVAENAGGVAFNLARQLVRLGGSRVQLLSVWGDDPEGQSLQRAAMSAGVELLGQARAGRASGQYTAVLEPGGDLALALCNIQVFDELPGAFWTSADALIALSDALVFDLNLASEDLYRLCRAAHAHGAPVALVAVSAPKMRNLPSDLQGVGLLLLNRDELDALGALLGVPAQDATGLWTLLEQRGLGSLLVTQGADGVTLFTPGGCVRQPVPHRIEAVDVTGAGDALCATTLHALWVQRLPLPACVALGQRAAANTLLSLDNV